MENEEIENMEEVSEQTPQKTGGLASRDIRKNMRPNPEDVVVDPPVDEQSPAEEETALAETPDQALDPSIDSGEEVVPEEPNEEKSGKEVAANVIEAVAGRSPITTGVVRGLEDIYNFANWLGDTLEKKTGLEALMKNTIGGDGLFNDSPDYGRGAFSKYMYKSESTAGQFVEEASRFGVGFAGGGPGKTVIQGGARVMALKAPKFTPYIQNVKGVQQISSSLRQLTNSPAFKKFNEGAVRGGVADFMITNEEDQLLTDFVLNLKPDIQNTFIDSSIDNDPPSLMKRKLQAVVEGYLIGGAAGTVLDDLFTVLTRVKDNGLFSLGVKSAEEQADDVAAQTAKQGQDPLVGKDYQGEKIVKVKDARGNDIYALESQVSTADPTTLKEGQRGLFPADAVPTMGIDEFTPDITNTVKEMVGRYDRAEGLAAGAKQAAKEIDADMIINDKSRSVLERVRLLNEINTEGLLKALKSDEGFRIKNSFQKDKVTLSDLEIFKDEWGFASADELAKMFPNTSAEEIAVYFYKIRKSLDMVNEFASENLEKLRAADPETLADFREVSDMAGSLLADFTNLGRKAGQSLAVFGAYKKQMNEAFKSSLIEAKLKGIDIEDLLAKVEAKQGLDLNQQRYLDMRGGSKTFEILSTVYHSNLLYGLVTQTINTVSGGIQSFIKSSSRALVANLSHDLASATAAKAYLKKMSSLSNHLDALKEAGMAFKRAQVPQHLMSARESVKYEQQFRVFKEMARANSHRPILTNVLSAVDHVTSVPGRGLNAMDTYFKQLGFSSSWSEMTTDHLIRNGMSADEALQMGQKVGRKDFAGLPEGMDLKALDARINNEISEVTFTMEPNKAMSYINKGIEWDIMGFKPLKFVVPFARVDMNIVRYTLQNTPGIHKFTKSAEIFKTGTQEMQERKMAEMMVASSTLLLGGTLFANSTLTGKGPTDERELAQLRRTGWKPYSLKVPGMGYIEMKRFGPVGNFLAMGASFIELMDSLEDSDEMGPEVLAASLATLTDTFTPQFMSESIPEFLDILQNEKDSYDGLMSFMGRIAAEATLPGAGIYSRNASLAGRGKNIMDYDFDQSRLLTSIQRVFPFLDTSAMPQVDFLGNDRSRSPFYDPPDMDLVTEYERLAESAFVDEDTDGIEKSILFMPPRRTIEKQVLMENARAYKLTNEEYYRYQKYAAGVYEGTSYRPPYGMPFKDLWREEMKAGYPRAQTMFGSNSDEAVVTWLRFEKDRYNQMAKGIMRTEKQIIEGTFEGQRKLFDKRNKMLRQGSIRPR